MPSDGQRGFVLPALVRAIKASQHFVYVYVVTNGSLLTAERARALFGAGLDQLSISMNYLDERHDRERKLPGLHAHLERLVPQVACRPLMFEFHWKAPFPFGA